MVVVIFVVSSMLWFYSLLRWCIVGSIVKLLVWNCCMCLFLWLMVIRMFLCIVWIELVSVVSCVWFWKCCVNRIMLLVFGCVRCCVLLCDRVVLMMLSMIGLGVVFIELWILLGRSLGNRCSVRCGVCFGDYEWYCVVVFVVDCYMCCDVVCG